MEEDGDDDDDERERIPLPFEEDGRSYGVAFVLDPLRADLSFPPPPNEEEEE